MARGWHAGRTISLSARASGLARAPHGRCQLAEVGVRPRDIGEGVSGLVLLGDVPIDLRVASRGDDAREVEDACAGGSVPRLWAGCAVLHVEQPDPGAAVADDRDGVAFPDRGPEDVELQVDFRGELREEHVPGRRPIERSELEGVVVIAEPDPAGGQHSADVVHLGCEAPHVVSRTPLLFGQPRHDDPVAAERDVAIRLGLQVGPEPVDADVGCDRPQAGLAQQPGKVVGRGVRQPGQLDGSVAGRGDRRERAGEIPRGVVANGPQLEGDLVFPHGGTIGQLRGPSQARWTPPPGDRVASRS
jgi:hypothetical protein